MKIVSILILICSSFLACTQAQYSNTKSKLLPSYTAKQYKLDLDQLAVYTRSTHPKFSDYISEEAFQQKVDDIKSELTDSTTIREFLWASRGLVASIGCGHTMVPTLTRKYPVADSTQFPMYCQFIDDELFVIDPQNNRELVMAGDKVLTINGISSADLRSSIFEHLSADGLNTSSRQSNINSDFNFYCAYQLNFPVKYDISYERNGQEFTTDLISYSRLIEHSNFFNSIKKDLHFSIDKSNELATITIRSFNYYNENLPKFKTFIDNCFWKLHSKGISKLIIDLRQNGGGDPYAASYLLQHIAKEPFQYYEKGTSRGYRDLQTSLELNENAYSGHLVILLDGKCFSTSGHLLSLLKYHGIGTMIGQESGATYTCNANNHELQLRNTYLTVYMATASYKTAVSDLPADRGIIPDIQVDYKLEDLISDTDRVMLTAVELLEKK